MSIYFNLLVNKCFKNYLLLLIHLLTKRKNDV
ncbi:hypothetical protein vBEcoMWL3_gp206c [Escherichia phage vB_EcoM_WL-3]|nr:hypothetical protein vBEcoMWL3_gp206c [Escherichia phage vB_EcoM_WL-3]